MSYKYSLVQVSFMVINNVSVYICRGEEEVVPVIQDADDNLTLGAEGIFFRKLNILTKLNIKLATTNYFMKWATKF